MTCSDTKIVRIGETTTDDWNGVFELIDVATDLNSVVVNIQTPWGSTDDFISINKGILKTYISEGKTYSIYIEDIYYWEGLYYVAKIYTCYEGTPVDPTGSLMCTSYPNDAEIWIDGKDTNEVTPSQFILMALGNHNVVYKKVDYNDCLKIIEIKRDQLTYVHCDLIKTIQTGSLDCTTYPENAVIYLDDEDYGFTNKLITDLDVGIYDLRFELDDYETYETTIEIELDKTTYIERALVEICIQDIKIQDQNYNPVEGVNLTINDVVKTTDINGEASFDLRFYEEYTIFKSYGDYSGEDTITGCKLNPQILHIVTPVEPTCIDYITQEECEDSGCYWWTSDNTCQNAPDGTTEYFDIYVKPFSWYDGKYEDAIAKALTISSNMAGKINNYLESIIDVTGIEYKGIDILKDKNKNSIIIRIYLKDTSTTTLAIPLVLLPFLPEIVLILTALLAVALVGVIIGTSDSGFTKEEVAEEVIGAYYLEDVLGCLQNYLDINREDASEFLNCLDVAQENSEPTDNCYVTLLEDYGFDIESTEAKENILNFLICMKVTEESKGIIGEDIFDDQTWSDNADDNITNLDTLIDNLENDVITPKEALDGGNTTKNESDNETDDIAGNYADDDCVFDIAGECIVTKKAFDTAILVGAGIAALVAYSVIKK